MTEQFRATLTIRVRDVAAATPWYERVFATAPIRQSVDRSLDGTASAISCFRLGGLLVWLAKLPQGSTRAPADNDLAPTLTFMTREPLAGVRRRLLDRGALVRDDEIKPDFPIDADGVRQGKDTEFFYIYDPDGNRFEFCRMLA